MIKILAIGDFNGKFPKRLGERLKKEKFDIILSHGDFANIKQISEAFMKYGDDYKKILGRRKLDEIRVQGIKNSKLPLKKLNAFGRLVYITIGNNEVVKNKEFKELIKSFENLNLVNFKKVDLRGISIVGYPYYTLDKENDQSFLKRLDRIIRKVNPKQTIFLSHNPPYNCQLDRIPDENRQKPGEHIGSKVSEIILKKYKLPLMVCGHLEEYQGKCKIGKTLIVNPGAAYEGKAAVIEFDEEKGKVRKVRFIR